MREQYLYTFLAPAWNRIGKLTGHVRGARYFIDALPLPRHQPLAALDLGCGTGIYSRALLEKYPEAHVTAVDMSPAMASECRQRGADAGFEDRMTVLTGDIRRILPTFQTTFDVILLGGVLEYVEPALIAPELERILKPGGYVLNAAIRRTEAGKALGKTMLFTPHDAERIRTIFEAHGLRHVLSMRLPRQCKYFPSWLVKEGQFYVRSM